MTKIEKVYDDEKGHNFVLHLINAFIRTKNTSRILDDSDFTGKHNCSVCSQKISSANKIISVIMKNSGVEKFIETIKLELNNQEESAKELQKETIKRILKDADGVLGVKSSDSTCILCDNCLVDLEKFVINKILTGDYAINRIITRKIKESVGS